MNSSGSTPEVMPYLTKMTTCSNPSFTEDALQSTWTTKQLKKLSKENGIPASGLKHELTTKAKNFID